MKNHETILVLDFGGQYNQLIARRVRDLSVYCEVVHNDISISEIKEKNPVGIIFTGGPSVVYEEDAPKVDPAIFELGVPILGICYGAQLTAYTLGGKVEASLKREYGKKEIQLSTESPIFSDLTAETSCWMSHTYHVTELPNGFTQIASTDSCANAAFASQSKNIYCFQYHPEVNHTPQGNDMISNFLFKICGCSGDWIMTNFINHTVDGLRK